MRRREKEVKDKAVIIDVLNRCHIGRLGTLGWDSYPMVKPLNFAYYDDKIYFHTAKEGEKIEDIKRDGRVCFEVDLPIAYIKAKNNPCEADYLYRSVIIKGRAKIVEERDEKLFALKYLMEKHQPGGGYGEYTEEKLNKVCIVRIDIEEMTGKEDLGDEMKETMLKALQEKVALPITIERGLKMGMQPISEEKNIIDEITVLEKTYWQKIKEGGKLKIIDYLLISLPIILICVAMTIPVVDYFSPKWFPQFRNIAFLILIVGYIFTFVGGIIKVSIGVFNFFKYILYPELFFQDDIKRLLIEDEIFQKLVSRNYNTGSLERVKNIFQERINRLEQRINFLSGPLKNYGAVIYLIGAIGLVYSKLNKEESSTLIIPAIVLGMIAGNTALNFVISRYRFYIYLLDRAVKSISTTTNNDALVKSITLQTEEQKGDRFIY